MNRDEILKLATECGITVFHDRKFASPNYQSVACSDQVLEVFVNKLLQAGAAAERSNNVGSSHPEDFCEQCGRENVTWFAPNDIWNMVARRDDGTDLMLCPACFITLAEEKGFINSAWKVSQENSSHKAEG